MKPKPRKRKPRLLGTGKLTERQLQEKYSRALKKLGLG